jgi:hypothetical protein
MRRYVERFGDMSPDGRLHIYQQDDGDVIIVVIPDSNDNRPSVAVEFCTYSGGGRSPKTREAILALMDAIEDENRENPQFKS